MGYAEHAEEARNLLRWARGNPRDLEWRDDAAEWIAVAQVHALLAIAAAIREMQPEASQGVRIELGRPDLSPADRLPRREGAQ